MTDEEFDLPLGHYRGTLDVVLAAIQRASFDDSVIELDGSPSEELFDFAEEATADDAELREKNRYARHGRWRLWSIQIGGGPLYLPLSHGTIARLREMLDRHADPEIAIGLRVLAGDHVLLNAPDVGDNEIWVSRRLGADSVAAIRDELGSGLTDPSPGA